MSFAHQLQMHFPEAVTSWDFTLKLTGTESSFFVSLQDSTDSERANLLKELVQQMKHSQWEFYKKDRHLLNS